MFPQGENKDELEAIILRLKHHDYAGYLSVRFSPLEQRVALSWLFGFFMDVEQISIKVNEPLLGEIRLQWWRDQLLKLLRGELSRTKKRGLRGFKKGSRIISSGNKRY